MNHNSPRNILDLQIKTGEGYRSEAAVIVLVNKLGEVLLVQEGTADTEFGREQEQWNFITETRRTDKNKKKETIKQTMLGGIREELLGGIREELDVLKRLSEDFKIIPETYREADFGPEKEKPSRARLIVMRYLGDPENTEFHSEDPNEIAKYQWGTPEKITELNENKELAPSVFDYYTQLRKESYIGPHEPSESLMDIKVRDIVERPPEEVLRK